MGRYILHCDLNNFYASVESLFDVGVRNKPLVVVGDVEKRHGIVLAKNAIAKSKGVATGDTVWEAKQKCGEGLVCKQARLGLYLEVSKLVKAIYREYSDRVESFGIDEAWIDISHLAKSDAEAVRVADNIRSRVIAEVGLTISVGVSFNKVFAKLGSDLKKPNATVLISESNFKEKIWCLPVKELLYVGRATHKKLEKANIRTIGELASTSDKYLSLTLGKVGLELKAFACGKDISAVSKVSEAENVKSFGNSTTCPVDLVDNAQVKSVIYVLAESVAERMRHKGYYGVTVSLWVKDNTLQSFERQVSLKCPTNVSIDIAEAAYRLFLEHYDWSLNVRAVGVRISGLTQGNIQCDIFGSVENTIRNQKLDFTIEKLRERFGYSIIKRGNIMSNEKLADLSPKEEKHIIHPVGFFKAK